MTKLLLIFAVIFLVCTFFIMIVLFIQGHKFNENADRITENFMREKEREV